ncbi:MAG: FHA domain-containing protein [Bdellovibrionales bacterium]|nr:FHA domain-containing protein [Bdellovibrionales bacterium]
MSLYIVVKTGEDAGIRFKVTNGLKMGRKNADYIIKDSSASGLHAQIKESTANNFMLIDLNSKNGIKINGIREDVVSLKPGLQFTIGAVDFEVLKDLQDELESTPPIKTPPKPPDSQGFNIQYGPPEVEDVKPGDDILKNSRIVEIEVQQHWNDILENFSQDNLKFVKNKTQTILPMNPALKLKFIRGVQVDTEWILGYGPRIAGPEEYDLTLYDPCAPSNTFALEPTEMGVKFKTKHPKDVLYNGRSCEQSLLRDGDEISFGETTIVVELIK